MMSEKNIELTSRDWTQTSSAPDQSSDLGHATNFSSNRRHNQAVVLGLKIEEHRSWLGSSVD